MQTVLDNELIMIIDDNPANLEVALAHLQFAGYGIETANSARQALDKLKLCTPDIFLIDIMMPVVDGFELAKILKSNEETADIPIIFITALNQPDDMVRGFSCGAVDYISKPFNKDELVSRVRNHLNLIKQTRTIKFQNNALKRLNKEKNGIIELTAHDLKNPLQSVLGFADILLDKIPSHENELINYVLTIKSSAQKAVNIIKDLMEVNMIEEGKLKLNIEKFDIRDALVKVIEDYLFVAENKKQIICYDETELECFVEADKSKMERIFDNLISNAIKFTQIGGKINIKCDVVKNSIDSDSNIIISIKDNGPGFTEDDKSKLFTKFAKLSAKPTSDESSTGLGLSIVKKLTELLNGSISLESSSGNGSVFTLKFKAK
jgi:two-component system sensor histidine kinase/response regulator